VIDHTLIPIDDRPNMDGTDQTHPPTIQVVVDPEVLVDGFLQARPGWNKYESVEVEATIALDRRSGARSPL